MLPDLIIWEYSYVRKFKRIADFIVRFAITFFFEIAELERDYKICGSKAVIVSKKFELLVDALIWGSILSWITTFRA